MRLSCRQGSLFAICSLSLTIVLGCGSNPSGPLNPELTGEWIAPGVDSYSRFTLQERGDSITGTLGNCSANTGSCETFFVTGVADLPHVVLTWVQDGERQSFDAMLSDDLLLLSGTYDPGPYTDVYHRQQPISGDIASSH